MIADHIKVFYLNNMALLEDRDMKGMALLYKLIKSVPGARATIAAQIYGYFKKQGSSCAPVTEDQQFPDHFVNRIMDFHAMGHKFIKQVFNGDSIFIQALDKACILHINQKPNPNSHSPNSDLVNLIDFMHY